MCKEVLRPKSLRSTSRGKTSKQPQKDKVKNWLKCYRATPPIPFPKPSPVNKNRHAKSQSHGVIELLSSRSGSLEVTGEAESSSMLYNSFAQHICMEHALWVTTIHFLCGSHMPLNHVFWITSHSIFTTPIMILLNPFYILGKRGSGL